MIAMNGRKSRRHKRARRHNPVSYNRKRKSNRRRRHNPAVSVSRPLSAVTAGFKPSVLIDAGVITAGAFGNHWLRNRVSELLPASVKTGIPSYGVGLATAGAMLFVPKYGQKLFIGAVLEEVMRAASEYVPHIPKLLGEYLTTSNDGMSDYLTKSNDGMSEYLNTDNPGLREYMEDQQLNGGDDPDSDDGLEGLGVGNETYEGAASTFE